MTSKKFRWDPDTREVYEVGSEVAPQGTFLGNNLWATGLVSEGAGCPSAQVPEFRREIEKAGISGVEIRNDGAAVFYSRAARAKYCRMRKMCDNDAGYGDAAPNSY